MSDDALLHMEPALLHMEPVSPGTSSRPPAPALLDFSPEEWLAILPFRAPASRPLDPAARRVPDPAADARKADPLTAAALAASLAGRPLPLAVFRFELFARPWTRRSLLRGSAQIVAIYALLGSMWVWGGDVTGDAFGRRQMVAGTVAVILTYLVGALGPLLLVARTPGTGMGYPSDLDLHAWAGIARWLQLVSRAGDAEAGTASQLVAHDADDPSCPCGLPECAGKLPRSAAWIQAGYRGTLALVVSLVQVFIIWTPLVHYGPQLAATAWGIALVALFCVTAANFAPFFFCNVEPNVASVGLAVRVQHRAMRLALSSFLGRCGAELRFRAKDGALTTPQEGTEAPDARAELHFRLHSLLAASWAVAVEPSLYDKVFISFNLAGQLVVAVIYVSTGNCIPAWQLLFVSTQLATLLANLVTLAEHNAQVLSIGRLLHLARADLRAMLASLPPGAFPPAGILAHESLLGSLADVEGRRARFLGFAVDFGVVRTVLVTLFTLGVGLWSVLRAGGVVLTVQSVCPGP